MRHSGWFAIAGAPPRIRYLVLLAHANADTQALLERWRWIRAALSCEKQLLPEPGGGQDDLVSSGIWARIESFLRPIARGLSSPWTPNPVATPR